MVDDGADGTCAGAESSTQGAALTERLRYYWSLCVAAMLLLIVGPPVLTWGWLTGRRAQVVYPWAQWGARMWLRLSGVGVLVRGREQLDPHQA